MSLHIQFAFVHYSDHFPLGWSVRCELCKQNYVGFFDRNCDPTESRQLKRQAYEENS